LAAGKESLQKEVQDTKSELCEMQTKLTAKDDEVKLLEKKLFELQGVLEQQRRNHDAEMQHQSAETAKLKGELEQERLKHDSSTKAMRATKESFLLKEGDGKESELREMQTPKNKEVDLECAQAQSLEAEKEILQNEILGKESEMQTAKNKEVESESTGTNCPHDICHGDNWYRY
jgi:hypothetical protein